MADQACAVPGTAAPEGCQLLDSKRPAEPPAAASQPPSKRSKKNKKKGKAGSQSEAEVDINPSDFARLIPVPKKAAVPEKWQPVQLSKTEKAAQLHLSASSSLPSQPPLLLSVTGSKGYRTARCSHGVHQGTWYCEVHVTSLGSTGHCRLGWCTKKAELQAPVGYDKFGYSYRDLEGSKVHKALREPFGEPFVEGDVIGLLLHMPPGGKPLEKEYKDIVRYKGALWYVAEPDPEPQPLQSSFIAFTKNGKLQGVAFQDILEGTYYPAASLYTLPGQVEGATATFNFGPDFKHAPPVLEGAGGVRPMSEVAGQPPAEQAAS